MDKLQTALSKILDEDSWTFVKDYISRIDNRDDALEYLQDLLDINNDEHVAAIDAFLNTLPDATAEPEFIAYNKFAHQDAQGVMEEARKKKKTKQQIGKEKFSNLFPPNPALPTKDVPAPVAAPAENARGPRRSKPKYVPLFTGDEVKAVMLPGRHACDCCATKHKLVNNCLSCGRIVCLQEGSGPCMTCGQLVCSKEEMEVLHRGSKKSEQLRSQLMKHGVSEAEAEADLKRAMEYKERLLEFDRSSARRTKVIDDEMDYFATDSSTWLSPTERAKLKAREEELHAVRHANRRSKVSLDFAGRQVVLREDQDRTEEQQATAAVYGGTDELVSSLQYGLNLGDNGRNTSEGGGDSYGPSVDPNIDIEAPTFIPGLIRGQKTAKAPVSAGSARRQALRNQDAELQELRDEGHCLSMHQPWASLLVRGIKQDEGRNWYSPHRGRLWIASTAKPPDPQEVREMEAHYRALGFSPTSFPKTYPSGCLLGCVDVLECLPQNDYREAYPEGDSGSPFVFVCANPRELVVKFPISGQHKIYKMDSHVHAAARKGIERVEMAFVPA